jgi:hypothetical protein
MRFKVFPDLFEILVEAFEFVQDIAHDIKFDVSFFFLFFFNTIKIDQREKLVFFL